jgi:hypothetical protein
MTFTTFTRRPYRFEAKMRLSSWSEELLISPAQGKFIYESPVKGSRLFIASLKWESAAWQEGFRELFNFHVQIWLMFIRRPAKNNGDLNIYYRILNAVA